MGWKSVSPAANASFPLYFGFASCSTEVGSWAALIIDGL